MTDKNKRLLAYGIAILAIIVAGVVGVAYPLPSLPEPEIGIQAIKDTEFRSVRIAHDLDVDGNVDVDGTVYFDDIDVDGGVTFNSTLDVDGATTLNSTLDVGGLVSSDGGKFRINDTVKLYGATDLDSTLDVDGNTDITGTLQYEANEKKNNT